MELLTAGQYLEEELRQGRSQASCRFNGRSGNAVDVCIKSEYASGFFFFPHKDLYFVTGRITATLLLFCFSWSLFIPLSHFCRRWNSFVWSDCRLTNSCVRSITQSHRPSDRGAYTEGTSNAPSSSRPYNVRGRRGRGHSYSTGYGTNINLTEKQFCWQGLLQILPKRVLWSRKTKCNATL